MEVVNHPYLEGVKCREDGAVYVPQSGTRKAHWTFGCRRYDGYLEVGIYGRHRLVHRLICEAFHGCCPSGKTDVDHLNRNTSNNRPENLRWVTHRENCRNRKACDEGVVKYGVARADDRKAYMRARYVNDPEYRERCKARAREYHAKKKAEMAQK